MEAIGVQVGRELDRLAVGRRQIGYLSALAARHGTTFVPPTTRQEASTAIARVLSEPARRRARRASRRRSAP